MDEIIHKGKGLTLGFDTLIGFHATRPVRWISVSPAGPYAQYSRSLYVSILLPRKRLKEVIRLTPDGLAWYWLERDGQRIWDSRDVFPIYPSLEVAQQAGGGSEYSPN